MISIPNPPFSKDCLRPDHDEEPLRRIPGFPHIKINTDTIHDYLKTELSVSKLNDIYPFLWVAGRKRHFRSLNRQLQLRREILITEDPAMHLVWVENIIYMKPVPVALFSWEFWDSFICAKETDSKRIRGPFFESACGLLHSYTKLIVHQSDYRIAISHNLIPDVGFSNWCHLAQEIRDAVEQPNYVREKRWEYGELRLARLNWIYKTTLRGYSYFYVYTEYGVYFGKHFQTLLLLYAYCTVILSAMQVVMSSRDPSEGTYLGHWVIKMCIRFGFGVIMTVFAIAGLLVLLFISLFLYNFVMTMVHHRKFKRRSKIA
jgi:hypothetical protein